MYAKKHYQCFLCCRLGLIHENQHPQHPENERKLIETRKKERNRQKIKGSQEREIKLIRKDEVDE